MSNLEKIFEEDSGSQDISPKLKSIRRLSCFEQICPSSEIFANCVVQDLDNGEFSRRRFASEGMAALSSLALSSTYKLNTFSAEVVKQASCED